MNSRRGLLPNERTCYPLTLRRLPIAARRWVHSVQVTLHWSDVAFEEGRGNRDEQVYVIGTMDDAGNGSNDTNPARRRGGSSKFLFVCGRRRERCCERLRRRGRSR
jgi:hypothetical protein